MDPQFISDISKRALESILQSSKASAGRAHQNIEIGLEVLKAHVKQPKTSSWREQTSWLLSQVKNESMDGLDMLRTLGGISPDECSSQSDTIKAATDFAKQALFSNPSPVVGAIAFQTEAMGKFRAKCMDIQSRLNLALYPEGRMAEQNNGAENLTSEKPQNKSAGQP